MSPEQLKRFAEAVQRELYDDLLPFWLNNAVDTEHGGFIGRMSNDGTVDPNAPKGLILNARLLWTFSALHRHRPDPQCHDMAHRAYEYLGAHFWDSSYGGYFWQLDAQGQAQDTKKKIYGQAFCMYALAEYHQAFADYSALNQARQVFNLIQIHSRDHVRGGYIEVCDRDWSATADSRLSDKDMDEKKSMNNHLHVLEAYTRLYRLWPDGQLREALAELVNLFDRRIVDPTTGHLHHFFDESWQPKSTNYTFGHDIEASWLLCEAAAALDDAAITAPTHRLALRLARVTLEQGLDKDGGLFYEGRSGFVTDTNRQWWPQAESVVGFLNAYQLSWDRTFLEAAHEAWAFIEERFVDREHGEWFWRIDPAGRPDPAEPKVSQWKGPYHSVRACLEIMNRLSEIAKALSSHDPDSGTHDRRTTPMQKLEYQGRLKRLMAEHDALIEQPNRKTAATNGVVERYRHPVLTAAHAPVFWRYDLDPQTNPFLSERLGVNSAFNVGAIEFEGRICLVARVEGVDRKSFFAVAESPTGIDRFRFRDYPVEMPPADPNETNVYDMRLTRHEDGWIYGVFCAERHDPDHPEDPSAAIARCGIARTRDLDTWQRLPDLQTPSAQQRNCVLHAEFIDGQYAFYTRPMADFKSTGTGAGIGWGLCKDIEHAAITDEVILDRCTYHTITEGKNGQGPAPIKTPKGWLHLAHGVRDTAAGYRYVLYMLLTDLDEPWKVIARPGGYFLAPRGAERLGDVSNVVFANGWVARDDGTVFIYYGSSDTRTHVATSTVDHLLDYATNTPPDALQSSRCVKQRRDLIEKNLAHPWWQSLR